MTERPFTHHRQAALGLLNANENLPHKTAGFLGHVCVASELTERQHDWFDKLLQQNGLPRLIEEGLYG